MSNIKFKSTPHPRILSLRDGVLTFMCTCGRQGFCNLNNFNKKTRCIQCSRVNRGVKHKVSLDEKQLVFSELYPYLAEDLSRSTFR
jgi:hypothetical protein